MSRARPSEFLGRWLAAVAMIACCAIVAAAEPAGTAKKGGLVLQMPGESFAGELPPLTEKESALRDALKRDVEHLAGVIGERNTPRHHDKLDEAKAWLEKSLLAAGYKPSLQSYEVRGRTVFNIEVEIPGADHLREIVIVGAHYDSAQGSPAANDNGSGVAATLALSRSMSGGKYARTLRLVFFTNEEPPYFMTEQMGSMVYARRCKERQENIVAMFSLETLGYYSDEKESQKYPPPLNMFYPTTGNFIGFIGNRESAELVQTSVGLFRKHARFPSQGGALPGDLPGVGWSDHWSFWRQGYPAVMITDTALYRYPHYHKASDTPDKVNFDHLARVTAGVEKTVIEILNSPSAR